VHREDAAKVLLLLQQVQDQTQRYLETAYGRSRLQARYDWDSLRYCGKPTFRTSSTNRGSERIGSRTESVFNPTSHVSRS